MEPSILIYALNEFKVTHHKILQIIIDTMLGWLINIKINMLFSIIMGLLLGNHIYVKTFHV